jgi:hypothetical protein
MLHRLSSRTCASSPVLNWRPPGGEERLRRNQGLYVYRNQRLINWGSWLRLIRQEELTKLARVRVDITNGLGHFWASRIKKSTA